MQGKCPVVPEKAGFQGILPGIIVKSFLSHGSLNSLLNRVLHGLLFVPFNGLLHRLQFCLLHRLLYVLPPGPLNRLSHELFLLSTRRRIFCR